MLIEVSVPYRAMGEVVPDGFRQQPGSVIPSPDGTTVTYDGVVETRAGTSRLFFERTLP